MSCCVQCCVFNFGIPINLLSVNVCNCWNPVYWLCIMLPVHVMNLLTPLWINFKYPGQNTCFSADSWNFSRYCSIHKFNNVSITGRAWFYPVIVCSKFTYCLSCGFINLYTGKVTLSMAALSHNKPARAGTAHGICGAQDCNNRNVLHNYCHVGYTEFSDIKRGYTWKGLEPLKFVYYL